MSQQNATTSQGVTFDREFYSDLVEMLRCKSHIWVEEQQTGHRVCAWCNACEACPHPPSETA